MFKPNQRAIRISDNNLVVVNSVTKADNMAEQVVFCTGVVSKKEYVLPANALKPVCDVIDKISSYKVKDSNASFIPSQTISTKQIDVTNNNQDIKFVSNYSFSLVSSGGLRTNQKELDNLTVAFGDLLSEFCRFSIKLDEVPSWANWFVKTEFDDVFLTDKKPCISDKCWILYDGMTKTKPLTNRPICQEYKNLNWRDSLQYIHR